MVMLTVRVNEALVISWHERSEWNDFWIVPVLKIKKKLSKQILRGPKQETIAQNVMAHLHCGRRTRVQTQIPIPFL